MTAAFLSVTDLSVHYPLRRTASKRGEVLKAVDGASFEVARGASLGIVGESGSGKSTTAAAILRLVELAAGRIVVDGAEVSSMRGETLRVFRRRMQMIFQDPYSSLNPRARVGEIIREPLDIQGIGTRAEQEARVSELLETVGLRPEVRTAFPHQFSGGQRQRIGIARALATRPDLVVCDEPVSALDVAIQAQVLNLLKRLQREYRLTYVFISHDLGVVRYMCEQVVVMYRGGIVEKGPTADVFARPLHPYTRALVAARPSIHASGARALSAAAPLRQNETGAESGMGCRYLARCALAGQMCRKEAPTLAVSAPGRSVACFRPIEGKEVAG